MSNQLSLVVIFLVTIFLAPLSTANDQVDEWHYTVRSGDNLWTISERFLPDLSYVKKLQIYNSIPNPYKIKPGTSVRIPLDWLKSHGASAHVVAVEGRTIVQRQSQQSEDLTEGKQLDVNDKVVTGDQSSAVIEFKDGSRVLVHDNTELQLERVELYPDSNLLETELLLKRGRIETKVPKKSRGKSIFKIKTPAASTAVRGTFLRTGANKSDDHPQTMQVEVLRGRVSVSGAGSNKQLSKGFGIVVVKGNPPGPIIRLLDAPQLIKPAVLIDRLSTVFEWNNIAGSNRYRIQVFSKNEDTKLVWNTISTIPRLTVPDLPDGHYVMKIHGIDAKNGLEGKDSTHYYTLDARPVPPLPASPDEDANIESKNLILRWSAQNDAIGYNLQISKQADFETTLDDQTVEDVEYINQLQLQPGTYYWRIATQATDEEGPFSDPQRFNIIPPAPKPLAPQGDDEHLIFRWQQGGPGLKYQIQLANDENFTNVVLDKESTTPRLEVDRPSNNRLYLRMRPIANGDFKGNWSTVQYVDPPAQKPWYLLMLIPLLFLLLLL